MTILIPPLILAGTRGFFYPERPPGYTLSVPPDARHAILRIKESLFSTAGSTLREQNCT